MTGRTTAVEDFGTPVVPQYQAPVQQQPVMPQYQAPVMPQVPVDPIIGQPIPQTMQAPLGNIYGVNS